MVVAGLGGYQLWASRHYMTQLQTHGNAETSSFALLAVWSSFVLGVLFLFGGLAMAIGGL